MNAISPLEASQLFDSNKVIFFDIRSENEFSEAHLPGSVLLPGSKLDRELVSVIGDKVAVFYCSTGVRTKNAWENIKELGLEKMKVLEGGMNAWVSAGLPIIRLNENAPSLSIARQVQLIIGLLVILMTGLAMAGQTIPLYVLFGIGAGLTFAGLTGSCMLARLVMLAPWNK